MKRFFENIFLGILPWALIVLFALMVLGVMLSPTGTSNSSVLAREVWLDQSGAMPFSEVRGQDFAPLERELAAGYVDGAHWIRLQLGSHDSDLILAVWPMWLDEVDVYSADFDSPIAQLGVSSRSAGVENSVLGASLMLAPQGPKTYWIRVDTTTTTFVKLSVVTSFEAVHETFRRSTVIGLLSSVLVIFIVVAMTAWAFGCGNLFLAYGLQQIVYLNYTLDFQGVTQILLSELVGNEVFSIIHAVSTFLVVFSMVAYEAYFISRIRVHWALVALTGVLAGAIIGTFALWIIFDPELGLSLVAWIYTASLAVFWIAALSIKINADRITQVPKGLFIAYASIVLTSVLSVSGSVLGGDAAHIFSIYWFNLGHGMMVAIPMLGILFAILNRSWLEKRQAYIDRDKAEYQAKRDKLQLADKSRFLSMLMHELNTPLSVATLALNLSERDYPRVDQALNATRDMRSIIDRCLHDDRLASGSIKPQWKTFDLLELVTEIRSAVSTMESRISVVASENLDQVCSDRQLVGIILKNLMENAVKYSDLDTPIGLIASYANRLDVCGISIEIANSPPKDGWPNPGKLFTRYHRETYATHVSGAGLGLHLAQGLAELIQGDLNYEKVGTEAVFELWIPLSPHSGSFSSRTTTSFES
ncbi:sensor histidine kinase [Sulfitobacter sp.]|uniref:sensor histidine kinase n=1 Tax=Sulfitobacter sp. TaxID=1903071 RepID=UPI003F6BB568